MTSLYKIFTVPPDLHTLSVDLNPCRVPWVTLGVRHGVIRRNVDNEPIGQLTFQLGISRLLLVAKRVVSHSRGSHREGANIRN